MAFGSCSRVFITMLLALLVLAAAVLAHAEGDDHATPPVIHTLPYSSSPSSEGSSSAKPEGLVDLGLCAVECGARCLGGKASVISTPNRFSFGRIIRGIGRIGKKLPIGQAICMTTCMFDCSSNQANMKPELYHCTLGCAYNSAAKAKLTGSDALQRNKELGSCYNKCEESFQG